MTNITDYILGQNGNYHWIEFPTNAFSLYELLKSNANVLIGKYLAVVCFDSGPLRLTDEEKINGWHEKKKLLIHQNLPEISSTTSFMNNMINGVCLPNRRSFMV